MLEGFGDARVYDVQLYSVGKNEKASEPLTVKVEPLTPPVKSATKLIRETFGGVAIDLENSYRASLTVILMGDTAKLGYLTELFTFYTSMPKGTFNYRGLDSIQYDFAVCLRDRWGNMSDTIEAALKPWHEVYIPKNTFREYNLTGDALTVTDNYGPRCLWDDFYDFGGYNYQSRDQPLPQLITWDMGVTVKLSRFKLWPRNHEHDRWIRGHPKIFELYGSLSPNPTGVLDDSWIPLGTFECVKPSPGKFVTQEDIDAAIQGVEFDFVKSDFAPDPFVPVRYMRFRTMTCFGGTTISQIAIQELSFWGTIQK
jgi:hypothetical protein